MVLSLSPSLSVAGTALWGALLLRRMDVSGPWGGGSREGLALLIFAVSLPVYLSFIGGVGPDIYGTGYGFTLWDMVLGALALLMFIKGSHISLVLMACLLAHAAGFMGSSNIFDTLVDGPSFILSMPVLVAFFFRSRQPLPNRPGL
jgi:hypothetical protein